METIISSGEVLQFKTKTEFKARRLGSIVLRCFENKMLGNVTLLLNNFLEIK